MNNAPQADSSAPKPKKAALTLVPKVHFETNPYKTVSKTPNEIQVVPRGSDGTEYFPKLPSQVTRLTPESYQRMLSVGVNRQSILVSTPSGFKIPLNNIYEGGRPTGNGSLWP
jgi:hypothetical protein